MANFDTLARVTGGISGTAPEMFVATTDDLLATVEGAGYVADLVAAGIMKDFDIVYLNYDMDGTPGQAVMTVDGDDLVTYASPIGGVLLAANNLSDVADAAVSATNLGLGAASDVVFASLTLGNEGLHLLDTNASHDLIIKPGSDLTADRILTVTTGDAARTLDISAANVTVSAFGATLVDDASKLVALTTLGVKRGTTAAYAGGGTSNAFVATGVAATDIVVASLLSSTNAAALTTVVPTANTLTVGFTADPGANTVVNWVAIATV